MRKSTKDMMAALVDAGIEAAKIIDYEKLTRMDIARLAGCSPGLVSFYLGDMETVRALIMREAVERKVPEIVARGILDGHPEALDAGPALRKKCAALFR